MRATTTQNITLRRTTPHAVIDVLAVSILQLSQPGANLKILLLRNLEPPVIRVDGLKSAKLCIYWINP